MKLDEYIKSLEKEPQKKALPHYIEVDDVNDWGVMKKGKWFVIPDCWGVVHKDGKYTFFITADDDIGRIWHTEEREDEDSLVEYIKKKFDIRMAAAAHTSTDSDIMRRFIQRVYGYSENQAADVVAKFSEYNDIFDEFRNFQRHGRMEQERGNKVTEQGYTAEKLVETYHLKEVEAYKLLVRLREEPEAALEEFKTMNL